MSVADLDFERKRRANDNADLTPRDLLRLAMEDLDKGDYPRASKCLLLIIEADDDPEQKTIHHHYRSGVTRAEEIAFLDMWKLREMERWRGR